MGAQANKGVKALAEDLRNGDVHDVRAPPSREYAEAKNKQIDKAAERIGEVGERLPLVGYIPAGVHGLCGNEAAAKRAAARCTNSTVQCGVAIAGVAAAPVSGGASLVAVGCAAGMAGAAAGNGVQCAIETTYTADDRRRVGTEALSKDAHGWVLDVAVGGAVGGASGAASGAAKQAGRAAVGPSNAGAGTQLKHVHKLGNALQGKGNVTRFATKRAVEAAVKAPFQELARQNVHAADALARGAGPPRAAPQQATLDGLGVLGAARDAAPAPGHNDNHQRVRVRAIEGTDYYVCGWQMSTHLCGRGPQCDSCKRYQALHGAPPRRSPGATAEPHGAAPGEAASDLFMITISGSADPCGARMIGGSVALHCFYDKDRRDVNSSYACVHRAASGMALWRMEDAPGRSEGFLLRMAKNLDHTGKATEGRYLGVHDFYNDRMQSDGGGTDRRDADSAYVQAHAEPHRAAVWVVVSASGLPLLQMVDSMEHTGRQFRNFYLACHELYPRDTRDANSAFLMVHRDMSRAAVCMMQTDMALY